jgi:zinc transport system permease protein
MSILAYDFVVRALLGALLTGLAAPAVGTYLVQRRLALMGDGIGHIAVTGVALGLLTGTSPTLTAVIVAVVGAVVIEVIRGSGRTSGDVALALLFYGGIAGGVLITGLAGQSAATLNTYLFGSITTISWGDVWVTATLAVVVLVVAIGLSPQLFAVAQDQEFAQVAGLNVRVYNLLVSVGGVVLSSYVGFGAESLGVAPGATIVLLSLAGFAAAYPVGVWLRRRRRLALPFTEPVDPFPLSAEHTAVPEDHGHEHGRECGHPAVPHGDHVDYVHDGHRHAPHGGHYDEH